MSVISLMVTGEHFYNSDGGELPYRKFSSTPDALNGDREDAIATGFLLQVCVQVKVTFRIRVKVSVPVWERRSVGAPCSLKEVVIVASCWDSSDVIRWCHGRDAILGQGRVVGRHPVVPRQGLVTSCWDQAEA